MAGTISIKSANQYETLNIYNSSSTNNSDPANPVTEITPSRITFPAGPTNVQTVTTALFLKGNSAEKLLKLKSSSSTQITDTTEADCFYINFTGTITDTDESKNPDIQFVEMTNGYNASGEPDVHNYITTYNSVDSGNNYFWNFNGCEYTWTGTKNTDWFTAKNWNRNSVPGKNSIILITEKVNEDLIIKLKFKYRTLDTKILVIKILEDILKKEDLERFKIYNPTYLIFKLKRMKIKDKNLKTFIKDCKLF